MVKNTTGGSKHKRSKNSNTKSKRTIIYPDNKETLFGHVIRSLGDCRFSVLCNDGVNRNATVRGKLYKNTYINNGDLVLVSLRDFETVKPNEIEKCDIILKYNPEEIQEIREANLLVYKDSDKVFLLKTVVSNDDRGGEEDEEEAFEFSEKTNTSNRNDIQLKPEDVFDFDAI
jgi:translation initiation factor 1A